MATTTKNLSIPLLEGSMPFRTESFNDAFQAIDANALGKTHAAEKSHWSLWQTKTAYKKQDVFRTPSIPSWGFWEVTKAGTSGETEPVGYGEDDTFTDGTCELVLRRLTKGGGSGGGTSVTTDASTATPWKSGESYAVNKLVSYHQSLWMCLQAHTSGVFQTDFKSGYWKKIDSDQTVVGSSSGYSQVTKLAVTATTSAPKEVQIPINETKSFCLPPVEVLKFKSGTTNVVVTECGFDNSDESDFVYDDEVVEFDGTMHLKTERDILSSMPTALGDGYFSVTDPIDVTKYRSIGSVTVEKG